MLKINATQSDDYFIVGLDSNNKPGIVLLDGQANDVVSSDPSTVVLTPDATPRKTTADFNLTLADGTVVLVPAGTATISSGKVAAAQPPAQVNAPITVTSHLHNADGSPVLDGSGVAIPDLTDTVTIVPGLLAKEGLLFGTPA